MTDKMPPARFRRQLKEQLPILESEGLLTPQQSQSLFARYQLDALSSEAMNTLLSVIYTIGAVLIAIGIISFVAAHWEKIPRDTKLIMIFSVMLVVHFVGFFLWKIHGSYPKFGHTLVLLGTLIFGANIGLVAQIFHIQSDPTNGFMAWTLGAIIIAYATKSVPNAVLAVITAIIALFCTMDRHPAHPAIIWFPLAAVVLFVPFIYYTKSRWALYSTLLLLLLSLPIPFSLEGDDEFGFASGLALAGVLLFAWGTASRPKESWRFISSSAWAFGIFAAFVAVYLCSFLDFCDDLVLRDKSFFTSFSPYLITFAALLIITVVLWLYSLPKTGKMIILFLHIAVMLGLTLVVGLPWFIKSHTVTILANLLLILMIVLLFAASFTYEDRRIFWVSVLMAALLILTRTLEYETQLLIKAIIFTSCGVGIIVAGVMFERFLKARRLSHA